MVPWWWIPVSWVIGELMGFMTIILCMGKQDEKENR